MVSYYLQFRVTVMTVYRTVDINILLHPHSYGWVMSLSLNNALNSFTATYNEGHAE